jgi:hypothetical protein
MLISPEDLNIHSPGSQPGEYEKGRNFNPEGVEKGRGKKYLRKVVTKQVLRYIRRWKKTFHHEHAYPNHLPNCIQHQAPGKMYVEK